uniref:Small ribosomal subunit protein eS4 central region domain-containing protein n=1 Tax=Oryza brachyantha TaxID=4533 RepID=J3L8T4_ORYBR
MYLFLALSLIHFVMSMYGKGTEEALEEAQCAQALLDKLGGAFPFRFCYLIVEINPVSIDPQAIFWSAQVQGVPATDPHYQKKAQVCIDIPAMLLVDGKVRSVRTDKTYPAGFMDVISIPKTGQNYRLLYDTKGRFGLQSIKDEDAKFTSREPRISSFARFGLCSLARRASGIPYLNTYDGRTIRYPDPIIKANDTIKIDLETNKIVNFIKFDEWFESLCYLKHTILIVICVQQTQGRSKIHKLKACSIR